MSTVARLILTDHVHQPIPIRTSDWVAYVEGTEESGDRGWGATEQEAIENLREWLECE